MPPTSRKRRAAREIQVQRDQEQEPQTSRAANETRGRPSRGPDAESDQGLWPLIESFRVGGKFVVQADLPGMQAGDVVVQLTETDLIISGERVRSARADSQTHQQERSFGPFRRSVRLPEDVRPATVRATVENGVLSIELEKKGEHESQSFPQRVHVEQGKPN